MERKGVKGEILFSYTIYYPPRSSMIGHLTCTVNQEVSLYACTILGKIKAKYAPMPKEQH